MSAYRDQPRTFDTLMALMPGAMVFTYLAGTLTPAPTYAVLELRRDPADIDALLFDLSVEHPNPLVSDAAGRLPPIFLDPAVSYRFIVQDAAGVEVHDLDPFSVFPGPDLITPLTDSGELMPFATLTAYQSQSTIVADEVIADSFGVFAELNLTDTQAYRIVLRSASGKLVYDVDPYLGDGRGIARGGGGTVLYVNPMIFTAGTGAVVTPMIGLNSEAPSIGTYISGGFPGAVHYTVGDYTGGISPPSGFSFFVALAPGLVPAGPLFDSVYIVELDVTLALVDAVIANTGNISEYVWGGNVGITDSETYTLIFSGGAQ